jgi:hypothetical protein
MFFAVRALFFDKMPATNWKVAWHQGLSIAVAERRDVPGFTGRSLKEGPGMCSRQSACWNE